MRVRWRRFLARIAAEPAGTAKRNPTPETSTTDIHRWRPVKQHTNQMNKLVRHYILYVISKSITPVELYNLNLINLCK